MCFLTAKKAAKTISSLVACKPSAAALLVEPMSLGKTTTFPLKSWKFDRTEDRKVQGLFFLNWFSLKTDVLGRVCNQQNQGNVPFIFFDFQRICKNNHQ